MSDITEPAPKPKKTPEEREADRLRKIEQERMHRERIERDPVIGVAIALLHHALALDLPTIASMFRVPQYVVATRLDDRLESDLEMLTTMPLGVAAVAIRNGASPLARAA